MRPLPRSPSACPAIVTMPCQRLVGGVWAALILAVSLLGCGGPERGATTEPPGTAKSISASPTAAHTDSPWLNARPGVRYVGDDACASCHVTYAQTYHRHSMGLSLFPVNQAPSIERFDAAARNPFKVGNIEYAVERRDGKTFHRETLRDGNDKPVAEAVVEIAYAVGSGVSGRSYLINHDGWLLMSSLTWYPRKQVWDLSPGYSVRNHHFTRPILGECLFCHCNQVRREPEALNRYHAPIFEGFTIGCERCHGPGELHVQARLANEHYEGIDRTIVNPKHLEPELREGVCQQCHLQGQHRVPRPGVEVFDYRPGLPLEDFLSVFVRHPDLAVGNKFVGQVEQMYASACFRGSNGAMGCVTCHDPHYLPPKEERPGWYRQRCLNCHADRGCSAPLAERRATKPEDNCIVCHMPVNEANIAHTAFSDHRVLRKPAAEALASPRRLPPGDLPLVPFRPPTDPRRQAGLRRDLGIALIMMSENHPERLQQELARAALPLLAEVPVAEAGDFVAWEAKANALWQLGRHDEAAEEFAALLARAPQRESTLANAASLATEMGRWRAARLYWDQAVRINPYRWRYRLGLATAHARQEDWHSAWYECKAGLRLHPFSPELRQLAITCQLALGDKDGARKDLEVLIALEPHAAERHRQWFDKLAAQP
ncbi:MAG: tetratricopeptide repeat protein [Gemmatales bacterium]|nr:tetratricopeptide repeat protein [Gemmatales bacterium]MDW8386806.1 tetratricopeptide repeat protein [Gemmatales bacterium]